MPVELMFLGRLRDIAGASSRSAACRADESLAALVSSLEPQLAAELASTRVRVSVNGTLTSLCERVRDGDEVAFLPPVSGG